MNYLLAFLFAGSVCAIAELIYDHSKLTPGHIVTLFVVIGAGLSFFNIYDKLLESFGGGASTLIMNFSHLLYQSAKEGVQSGNFFKIFQNMLVSSGGIIVFVCVVSTIFALIKRSKP